MAINQTCADVHLDLSGSCADRTHAAVIDACIANCRAITALALRDCQLDAELLTVIPALARMPNLRRLDLGGANFAHVRKTPATVSAALLELVKLVNEEDSVCSADSSGD